MAENYVLLETIQLTENAASVTFDNIPQTGYTDLKVVVSARDGDSNWVLNMQFNGTNGSTRYLQGNGSSASSGTQGDMRFVVNSNGSAANIFGNTEIYIPNYSSTTQFKSVSMDSVSEENATTAYMRLIAGLWSSNSAITSITFTNVVSGNIPANNTFSLYGIASLGTTPTVAPLATGGNIVGNDGTYWYHTFLSSGTFIPQTALTCDYLVVAGGGSSAYRTQNDAYYCGGGGGGGLLTSVGSSGGGGSAGSALSLLAQNYTVTVGAGGAANAGTGTNGNNSSISTITAIGGGGGGGSGQNGLAGGSGGGAASDSYTQYYGGAGTAGQGYAGGNMVPGNALAPGAGGGAGGIGGNGSGGKGGTGGAALQNSITGTAIYYAGGGAGGRGYYSGPAVGDDGVGYVASTPNRGMGGGRPTSAALAAGGSGIVIIRYPMA